MRAKGPKADLALVVADEPAVSAGVFTTNVVCAAPVTYCRKVLSGSDTARAVRLPAAVKQTSDADAKYRCVCPSSSELQRKEESVMISVDMPQHEDKQ
jgi:glutamate N-acetyltransferase/amino-acid N-acetyltransferase